MLCRLEETVPLRAAQMSQHIKMEPEEPNPEGASREDSAPGGCGQVPLSPGSKEKALLLPGGGRTGRWKTEILSWGGICGRVET